MYPISPQGRKSFPSGHSSFAFSAFGFCFLYLSAKMRTFVRYGRQQQQDGAGAGGGEGGANASLKLVASLTLLLSELGLL